MDVDELLSLDRELTDEETAFMERELLKLARELEAAVASITEEASNDEEGDPEKEAALAQLRNAAGRTVASIEAAIAVDAPTIPHEPKDHIH